MRKLLALLLVLFLGIVGASLVMGQPSREFHVSMKAPCMSSSDESKAFDIYVRSSLESVVPPPGLIEGCDIIVIDSAPIEIEVNQFYEYGRKSCPYLEGKNITMEVNVSDRFSPEVSNTSGTEVVTREGFQWISIPFSEECQINGTGTAFLLVKPKGEEYVLNMPKGDKADLIFILKDMTSRGKTIGGPIGVNVCTVSSGTGAMKILKDRLSPLFSRIAKVSKEISELPNRSCDRVEILGIQVPLIDVFRGPDVSSLKTKLHQIREKLREIVEKKMVVTVKKWRDYEREQVIKDVENLENKLALIERDVKDVSAAIEANYCVAYNLIVTLGIPLILFILLVLAVRRR